MITKPELAGHQLRAVAQSLATMQRHGGILLADEPGLGKSFVAAAVAGQLSRDGYEIEILVPASLLSQWSRTLDRFEVEAILRSHDALLRDRFVPCPAKRLLIVDEAHAFRNPLTRRYDALARRSIGALLLLLTATPFCNRTGDLLALLALIATDDALRADGVSSITQAFQSGDRLLVERCLTTLVIRRGYDVLPAALRFGHLHRKVIRHPAVSLHSLQELRFPLLADGVSRDLLRRLMIRRLESSEAALSETIARQKRFYERALDAIAGGRELTRRDYRALFATEDQRDAMQQVLFWDVFVGDAASTRPEELEHEIVRLEAVSGQLGRSPETKLAMLLERIASDDIPTLVFTEAIATAQALFAALRPYRKTGLATSRRSWPPGAIEAFVTGRVDVLVATDLVSEGLDLQRAGVVVHYDLPWNPVRLDQRNGRAFRIGQTRSAVTGIYFVPERAEWNSGVLSIIVAKNRLRKTILRPCSEMVDPSVDQGEDPLRARRLALPRRLPRDAPELSLSTALRAASLPPPPGLWQPHRAGLQRLIEEMSRETLDPARLRSLEALLLTEPGQSL